MQGTQCEEYRSHTNITAAAASSTQVCLQGWVWDIKLCDQDSHQDPAKTNRQHSKNKQHHMNMQENHSGNSIRNASVGVRVGVKHKALSQGYQIPAQITDHDIQSEATACDSHGVRNLVADLLLVLCVSLYSAESRAVCLLATIRSHARGRLRRPRPRPRPATARQRLMHNNFALTTCSRSAIGC